MPSNCWKTLIKLWKWNYLSDDCFDEVLKSIDAQAANKLMLNYLIENYTANVLEFCNILEIIPDASYELSSVVITLREGITVLIIKYSIL